MSDRDALIEAIRNSRNLTVAADRLDVSRRTLQNRMREFGLPRGRGGRPKRSLVRSDDGLGVVVGLVALVGGGLLFSRWLRSRQAVVAGDPR